MTESPLMRLPEVEALVCMKKGSIYKEMGRGTFPRPVKIAARAVAWRREEIMQWIESLQKAE